MLSETVIILSKEGSIGEKEAVQRLVNGDIRAFDYFYHEYKKRIFGLVFRIVKSKEEAEGLVHDTFVRLWAKRAGLAADSSIGQWLFTVAYNLSIDRMRKLLQQQEYGDYIRYVSTSHDVETEKQVDFHLLQEKVDSFLERQPERRRRIYELSRKEGLSNPEIAEKLGISTNTVENHLVKILKDLRIALNDFQSLILSMLL